MLALGGIVTIRCNESRGIATLRLGRVMRDLDSFLVTNLLCKVVIINVGFWDRS